MGLKTYSLADLLQVIVPALVSYFVGLFHGKRR